MIEAFDKIVADYESDIDTLTEELGHMTHAAEFAYERMVTIADALDALRYELDAAGAGMAADEVEKLFEDAEVYAGEISMLVHPMERIEMEL